MKIINASYEILSPNLNGTIAKVTEQAIYEQIERAGRTCYKSEDKITEGSAEKFVRGLIKRGHEAMLEHASITVRFTVDRGVSHELVRHRLASFAQESTRYCNYSQDKFGEEITVIEPCFFKDVPGKEHIYECISWGNLEKLCNEKITDAQQRYVWWAKACIEAENSYFNMLSYGATPQEARAVLPNSLKTEVVMTANLREWRHFLKLRAAGTTGKPHPQMLEVAVPLLKELQEKLPAVFDDIQITE